MDELEKFITKVIDAAQKELRGSAMYYAHASMFTGEYFYFRDVAKEHGDDEFRHFNILCEQINLLGGVSPVAQYAPVIVFGNEEMLNAEKQIEFEARMQYTELYEMACDLRLYGVAKVVAEILADEDSHDNDISNVLAVPVVLPVTIPEAL